MKLDCIVLSIFQTLSSVGARVLRGRREQEKEREAGEGVTGIVSVI